MLVPQLVMDDRCTLGFQAEEMDSGGVCSHIPTTGGERRKRCLMQLPLWPTLERKGGGSERGKILQDCVTEGLILSSQEV